MQRRTELSMQPAPLPTIRTRRRSTATPLTGQDYGYGVQAYGGYKGVYGTGQGGNNYPGSIIGVEVDATNDPGAGNLFGVYGYIYGGSVGYAVYGYATGASGTNAAGYFNGNVYATTYLTISERKFKKDIAPVENALSQILRLKPAIYQFKKEEYKAVALPEGKQLGLIADEVKQVFPELVQKAIKPARYDEKDRHKVIDPAIEYEAVNYQGLIPVLIASTQEQQGQIEALKKENSALKERLSRIETMLTKNSAPVSLSSAYLENPVPNPSKSSTLVRYGVPDGSSPAKLTLTNAKGQLLTELSLNNSRTEQVSLNTANFSVGTYTCTLWVDGRQVVSRQLVITRRNASNYRPLTLCYDFDFGPVAVLQAFLFCIMAEVVQILIQLFHKMCKALVAVKKLLEEKEKRTIKVGLRKPELWK